MIQARKMLLCLSLLVASGNALYAQGIITTIAGDGITQYIGDGWPATLYSLAAPGGLCVDKYGNVFDADYAAPRIRRIDKQDTIITYAGTGTPGFTGNGGPASAATFNQPIGVAADTSGNIYVLEEYNNAVRRIDRLSGIITTVCGNGGGGFAGDGGPATAAHMEQPAGLCVDKAGNIYIADKGNNRIRKVDAASGLMSTVAGNGITGSSGDGGPATSAKLSGPKGVCTDNSGNIYIADYNNHRIRKVDAATGIITTIAGTGTAGFSGDNGMAAAAALAGPNSVFMGKSGVLYISDHGNNRIRAITPAGKIQTVAGSGLYGYLGDGGPAINATFLGPSGVCTDDSENIYIADFGNSAIRKVSRVFTAVSDVVAAHSISLYPNPSTGIFTITTDGGLQNSIVTVVNTIGQVVYTGAFQNHITSIDLSNMPTGMYCVRIHFEEAVVTKKVMITH